MQIEVEDVENVEGAAPAEPETQPPIVPESTGEDAGAASDADDESECAVDAQPARSTAEEIKDRFVLDCSFEDEDAPAPADKPPQKRPAPALVACPDCGRKMQPRTFKYSHSRTCPGLQKAAVAAEVAEVAKTPPARPPTPQSEPGEPAPPQVTPKPYRPPVPPPPAQEPPPFPDVRLTPHLRSRALLRRDYEARSQRYAGLFAGSLPA